MIRYIFEAKSTKPITTGAKKGSKVLNNHCTSTRQDFSLWAFQVAMAYKEIEWDGQNGSLEPNPFLAVRGVHLLLRRQRGLVMFLLALSCHGKRYISSGRGEKHVYYEWTDHGILLFYFGFAQCIYKHGTFFFFFYFLLQLFLYFVIDLRGK